MYKIRAKNINEAMPMGMSLLKRYGVERTSRAGNVIEMPAPVTTEYVYPRERVLTCATRNANPFFHLIEALWILAGRKDVATLTQFNARMAEFSDDGETFHAPYGYRLRRHFKAPNITGIGYGSMDQITRAIGILKESPDSRQAVLQIWDCEVDLGAKTKDIPCNDLVFLKIRDGQLHMTVCCRSNDVIWGAYGANVVQFSMLQEYIAGMVGVNVGRYYQVSDSFHAYVDNPQWDALKDIYYKGIRDPYKEHPEECKVYPLVEDPEMWDKDLSTFMCAVEFIFSDNVSYVGGRTFANSFFKEVALPMLLVWVNHKSRNYRAAKSILDNMPNCDWKFAANKWIYRVQQNYYNKNGGK